MASIASGFGAAQRLLDRSADGPVRGELLSNGAVLVKRTADFLGGPADHPLLWHSSQLGWHSQVSGDDKDAAYQ